MPLLFSYGTLQQESVQHATFGRSLNDGPDELVGFEPAQVEIADPEVVAETGETHYANAMFNGRDDSRVAGTALEVTDAELAAADAYEHDAAYERIETTLASGKRAWVYVHRPAP